MSWIDEAKHIMDSNQKFPVGVILNSDVENYIIGKAERITPQMVLEPKIFGVPIYSFDDVPRKEFCVFYSHDTLTRYIQLRKKVSHKEALQELKTFVDKELIEIGINAAFKTN